MLDTAARLDGNPDAHLVRRARASIAAGDTYAALTHLRALLEIDPSDGSHLWFYAQLAADEHADTFLADMASAIERLHPSDRPLDFMVGSLAAVGDERAALTTMRQGIRRDCSRVPPGPQVDNCVAWYQVLAGHALDDALIRIQRALDTTGDRPDFLDTKAMVHLARGELTQARDAARAAARVLPQDPYVLWQAQRIAAIADGSAP